MKCSSGENEYMQAAMTVGLSADTGQPGVQKLFHPGAVQRIHRSVKSAWVVHRRPAAVFRGFDSKFVDLW